MNKLSSEESNYAAQVKGDAAKKVRVANAMIIAGIVLPILVGVGLGIAHHWVAHQKIGAIGLSSGTLVVTALLIGGGVWIRSQQAKVVREFNSDEGSKERCITACTPFMNAKELKEYKNAPYSKDRSDAMYARYTTGCWILTYKGQNWCTPEMIIQAGKGEITEAQLFEQQAGTYYMDHLVRGRGEAYEKLLRLNMTNRQKEIVLNGGKLSTQEEGILEMRWYYRDPSAYGRFKDGQKASDKLSTGRVEDREEEVVTFDPEDNE